MSKLSILKQKNKRDVDMTQGSIFRHLITFAFPLLIGNIFQQLYNTVDTWVVGNYVSNEAFSAVGTVGPVINMLIGIFLGLSSGAGVVISQYYGAKRYDKVRDTVHTSIVMTLILAVLFTLIGIAMIPFVLNFMKTPAEVMPESSAYLTIYFAGVIGLMLYNMGAGILRAVGDSKRPFYFLVVSAVLNIILDLVFVLSLGMGVEGVAYATIISQGVSAMLVFDPDASEEDNLSAMTDAMAGVTTMQITYAARDSDIDGHNIHCDFLNSVLVRRIGKCDNDQGQCHDQTDLQ